MPLDTAVFLVILCFALLVAVIVCSVLAYRIGEEHGRRESLFHSPEVFSRKESDDAS